MNLNDNYPPMTSTQLANAPWNKDDRPKERDFDVYAVQTLVKSATVSTSDYYEEVDELDPEDGGKMIIYNTEETNWESAYLEDHRSPIEIIEECKKLAEKELEVNKGDKKLEKYYLKLIEDCENWKVEEFEVGEE